MLKKKIFYVINKIIVIGIFLLANNQNKMKKKKFYLENHNLKIVTKIIKFLEI